MKKLTLLMLVAMVPLLTMAQKRTKKGKDTKTEITDKSSDAKANFMIIKGIEIDMFEMDQLGMDQKEIEDRKRSDITLDGIIQRHSNPSSSFHFTYDIGGESSKESEYLTKSSRGFRSMAQAVHHAQKSGWNFVNSTIVVDDMITIHYYYMKR
ncbi:MAG: hypothetical protein P8H17_00060 [Flavobacteriales bacterium]|nr:hypothetical protein [Flavobacteriales bacterium]